MTTFSQFKSEKDISLELQKSALATTWSRTSLVRKSVLKSRLSFSTGSSRASIHVLHELGGSPITKLTTKGKLETLVHRLGGEEVQQPDLQNHVL